MIRHIQNAFTTGEISPQGMARTDFSRYSSAAQTLLNFLIRPFGGVQNRSGFRYIAGTKFNAKASRLIPFEYSTEQAYILEFGDQYIRFYKDGGQIEDAGAPYEIASPYLEADLPLIKFCQSADTMFLAHPDYAPRKLTRSGHTSWTLTQITFTWGPFRDENTTSITMDPSAIAGNGIDLVASADFFDAGHVGAYFMMKDGYMVITSVTNAQNAVANVIENLTDHLATTEWSEGAWSDYRGYPMTVSFDNDDRLTWGGNASEPQRLWGSVIGDYECHAAGSDDDAAWLHRIGGLKVNAIKALVPAKKLLIFTTGGEWWMGGDDIITPSSAPRRQETTFGSIDVQPISFGGGVAFLQRPGKVLRLYDYQFANDRYEGAHLSILAEHMTESNLIEGMCYQQHPNQIVWCRRDDGYLLALTLMTEQQVIGWSRINTEGEFESEAIVPGTDEDELWVIVNRTVDGSTVRYVERMDPTFRDDDTMDAFFVDAGLSYEGDEADIEDITQADPAVVTSTGHPFDNGDVVRLADIVGMTELNNRKLTVANKAANTFELSGVDSSGYTAYTSGGTARKCATTLSGLDHLEGEEVTILADGATVPSKTVSGGSITLDNPASVVHAGLGYVCDLETVNLDVAISVGTIQGLVKRITEVTVRFFRTFGAWIGPDEDSLREMMFWDSEAYLLGEPPSLYTGDKKMSLMGAYSEQGSVFIRQTDPLPITVLGVISEVEI